MNIAASKKIINSCAPVVTGVITSLGLFIYRYLNGSKQYEYAIPLICGALCTLLSMYIMDRIKRKKEITKEAEAAKLTGEMKEKHALYSERIKSYKQGSSLFAAYEEKIIELINLEHKTIVERSKKIDSLDREIKDAESFIEDNADKVSEIVNKRGSS